MWTTATVFVAAIVGIVTLIVVANYVRLFMSLRGKRVVTCPETKLEVGVEIDAARAARTMLIDDPKLQIAACSRWPEKADCAQECLSQVEAHPEDSLMRNILTGWYADKDCILCGRSIGTIQWHDPIPALRAPDGKIREWSGITAEELTELLKTSLPVCWNCELAEDFRVEHSALVTDRAPTVLRNRLIH